MDRPIRIRWPGTCATCGTEVPARSHAWWDHEAKALTCLTCRPDPEAADGATPVTEPVAAPVAPLVAEPVADPVVEPVVGLAPEQVPERVKPVDRGVPGRSARAEGERRSAKREERIRAKHPRIGGLVLAVTDDPTSTKVWAQGAVGEERIGAFLEQARPQGIEVLHDRRVPGSRANIDHLVVAPSGIWVVDPKRYLSGRLERRDVGGWRRTDLRLFVGNRDKTKLVDAMNRQVQLVRGVLARSPHADVAVHGVLCFVDTEIGFFTKPFTIDGVLVTWRKRLLAPMLEVGGAPELDEATRASVVRHLAERFRPAAGPSG